MKNIHQLGRLISEEISYLFDDAVAEQIRIIYGGSVSPENTKLIVSDKAIDGVLLERVESRPERYAEVVKVIADVKKVQSEYWVKSFIYIC